MMYTDVETRVSDRAMDQIESAWWDYRTGTETSARMSEPTLRLRMTWQSLAQQYAALRQYIATPGAISFSDLNQLRYTAATSSARRPDAALHLTIELLRMGRRSEAYTLLKRLQSFAPDTVAASLILYARIALVLAASGAYARAVNFFANATHSFLPNAAAFEALAFFNEMQANAFAASQLSVTEGMPIAGAVAPVADAPMTKLPVPPISLIGSAQAGLTRGEIDALFGDPSLISKDIALYNVSGTIVQVVYQDNTASSVHVS